VSGDPQIVHTGPGSDEPPHHEHEIVRWLRAREELEEPIDRSLGLEVDRGEPQISQTGPSLENSPHHSHAIFVSAMTIQGEALPTPL
jgi:hypothetical protein